MAMRLKTLTYGLAACFALVGPVLLLCKDNFPDPLPVKAIYHLLLSLWYVSPFLLVALAVHYGKHSITTISALVATLLAGLLVIWHSGELLRLKPSSAFMSMFVVTISQHAIVIPILALSFVFRMGMAGDKQKGADASAPSSDR
jgi:hypothetical protein